MTIARRATLTTLRTNRLYSFLSWLIIEDWVKYVCRNGLWVLAADIGVYGVRSHIFFSNVYLVAIGSPDLSSHRSCRICISGFLRTHVSCTYTMCQVVCVCMYCDYSAMTILRSRLFRHSVSSSTNNVIMKDVKDFARTTSIPVVLENLSIS